MKKTLLMTTALVAVMTATNVYAEDLNISAGNDETISEKKDFENINVNGGKLTLTNGRAQASKNVSISGGDITIEQGSEVLSMNGNVNISGGTISIDKGDISADSKELNITGGKLDLKNESNLWSDVGNINISGSNTSITLDNSKIVIEPENYTQAPGDEAAITISGGNLALNNNSQIVAGATGEDGAPETSKMSIKITGGTINLDKTSAISLTEKNTGDLNISGGKINGTEIGNYGQGNVNISGGEVTATDIGAEQGSVTISNGTVNMVKVAGIRSEGLYARDNMTIKGGTINMSGNENLIWGKNIHMTGGTLNIKDSTAFITQNTVNIDSGTVNIAENSSLGWATASGDNFTFDTVVGEDSDIDLGSNAVLNLAGTLNANIESPGTINILNNNTKIAGDVEISNGGVMNVGLNKATIGGDITFDTGSTLKLSIADEGNGSVSARNIVAENNAKLALNVSKTMEIGDTAKVKLFDTTGKFDNGFVEEISNNRYKVEALKNADDKFTGEYNIKYENSASDVVADAGGSVNNAKTAEAWDSISSSTTASAGAKAVASVLSDLSQNNEQAYVAALTAVAPEVAPAVQQTSTETANQVFGAVGTRLTGGTVSTGGEGMSSGDSIFKRGAMWVQGLFNKSKLDDTSKAKGFDADTNGVAFGAEKYVNDDVKVGVGYAYSQTDIDGFMRSTDVDTHTAIVYGEYKPSNWYVNGIATYGWSDYEENKNVAGVGVKADYDVETFGLQAMTGYDMQVKGFGFTPEAGLRYVHIKQDGYKDSADQRVSANDSDILTGVIGAKVSKSWKLSNGMNIKPEARIAATYDLMNDDVNSVVTLANGSAYAVDGEALDRFGMEFGAGVTAEVNDNVELSLGYEGKFREDYQDHTGLINAKYKF